MSLSPATFYDDNGVVRLQGQLDGGAVPSVQVYGPYTVAHDTPGASLVLWNAKAGDLILDLFVLPTVSWVAAVAAKLEIYCDNLDFIFPRSDTDNALTVAEDNSRFTTPAPSSDVASARIANATPSLMKIDADVICDVIGAPSAGEAKIWALVFPA